jgi:hypothetical protein
MAPLQGESTLFKSIPFSSFFKDSGGRGINWRPQRDSNPRRRRERPVSWARLDDGDVQFIEKK